MRWGRGLHPTDEVVFAVALAVPATRLREQMSRRCSVAGPSSVKRDTPALRAPSTTRSSALGASARTSAAR